MLGDRLSELRNKKNLTQEQLAKLVGISRGTYAHYEINKRQPDYETLQKLADFFEVTVDYLLGRTDVKNNEHKINIDDVDDPDDDFFLHGYLDATEEEKKEMRRYFYEMVKRRKELQKKYEEESKK